MYLFQSQEDDTCLNICESGSPSCPPLSLTPLEGNFQDVSALWSYLSGQKALVIAIVDQTTVIWKQMTFWKCKKNSRLLLHLQVSSSWTMMKWLCKHSINENAFVAESCNVLSYAVCMREDVYLKGRGKFQARRKLTSIESITCRYWKTAKLYLFTYFIPPHILPPFFWHTQQITHKHVLMMILIHVLMLFE